MLQKSGIFLFLISCASLYYLLNAQILLGHYDLGWHLAAGDLIRQQGSVPLHDPWAFTSTGREWFNLSWLWDVSASFLFQHAGFGGLILLTLACGAIIAGYLASLCLGRGASMVAVCIVVLSAALLYPAFASFPNVYLAASPNLATMLFAVVFYGECLKRTRTVLLLPVLMLLWSNLHGGFTLGIFLVGGFFGLALLKREWTHVRLYGLALAGCLAATLVTPLGLHLYDGVRATLGSFVQAEITEWWPYYRNIAIPGSIPGMLYMLMFAALELGKRAPCPIEARLLSWLFLFLGLYQFRYMAFFFLFSTMPLALDLDPLLSKGQGVLNKALLIAGIVAACALPLAWVAVAPAFALPPMLSKRDVRTLETRFPHARLLNHWNYGGLLIFYDRGRIPLFVDGRASTAYPDPLLRDYFTLVEHQPQVDDGAWDKVLAKYHIDTVLWMNTHQELRRFLVGQRGWREAYRGAYASIYVKP